jgi:hypothetical protein
MDRTILSLDARDRRAAMMDKRLGVALSLPKDRTPQLLFAGKRRGFAGNIGRTTLVEASQAGLRISFARSKQLRSRSLAGR